MFELGDLALDVFEPGADSSFGGINAQPEFFQMLLRLLLLVAKLPQDDNEECDSKIDGKIGFKLAQDNIREEENKQEDYIRL